MAELRTYTQEGYQSLLSELDHMKAEREKNKKEISEARSYGDLSENSEYDEAKSNQAKIAIRIAELEEMVKNAVVQDEGEIDYSKVNVGSTVEVYNETKGKVFTYQIVGSYEADALNGLISDESPIGRELLGHRAGDTVTVLLPNGKEQTLEVKSVHRS
jgi:transcription elongation factor GreA